MRLIDSDVLVEEIKQGTQGVHHDNTLIEKAHIIEHIHMLNLVQNQPTIEVDKNPILSWIPIDDGLPECEEEVWIQTEKGTVTTAMYEDGTISEEDTAWNWNEIDYDYDEETDIRYIPKGWWEYKHFAPDDVYNYEVDDDVVAWMPLPKPYKGL